MTDRIEELLRQVNERAGNLYLTRQFRCAGCVMATLNRGLGGGIPTSLAVRLASGFPGEQGECGCNCAALTGGIMALGLFLTHEHLTELDRENVESASRRLRKRFRENCGESCADGNGQEVNTTPEARIRRCAGMAGLAAETAARLILEYRPELLYSADWEYLSRNDSMVMAGLKQLAFL